MSGRRRPARGQSRHGEAPAPAEAPKATPRRRLSQGAIFGIVCAAVVLLMGSYVAWAAVHTNTGGTPPAANASDPALRAVLGAPHLVFLVPSGGDPSQSVVALAPLQAGTTARVLTGLHCQRTYFAAGRGICLGSDLLGAGYLYGSSFQPGRSLTQPGLASRSRVSPDGRLTSSTVFVTGHSYTQVGFSTQTLLTDTATGATTDLERFTVTRDGQQISSPDFNFWGVTFLADSRHFYATLGTGGHTYLVEGDAAERTAKVVTDGVECPDLSPDGTRIAYKHAVPGTQRTWRLHVLDLRTMKDTPLAETRNVDDQAEWLDDGHVVYGLQDEGPPPTLDVNLWTVPADGSGAPSKYLAHAESPAVIR